MWGDLRPRLQLVRTPHCHVVALFQIAENLDQAAGPDTGPHVDPFGTILPDANDE